MHREYMYIVYKHHGDTSVVAKLQNISYWYLYVETEPNNRICKFKSRETIRKKNIVTLVIDLQLIVTVASSCNFVIKVTSHSKATNT